ncbi:hypothetical protein NMY22_g4327 [Coprinellus aureogranulatus]|nr:hypothetical protein NMY22_g4327 [Coprinellus aureogranulatus]
MRRFLAYDPRENPEEHLQRWQQTLDHKASNLAKTWTIHDLLSQNRARGLDSTSRRIGSSRLSNVHPDRIKALEVHDLPETMESEDDKADDLTEDEDEDDDDDDDDQAMAVSASSQ